MAIHYNDPGLRNMITLFTHYFDALEYMLGRFLELLTLCICQENDTIARIGSNCLQQLILQNVTKFQQEHWSQIVGAFVELFSKTTAYELFTAAASMSKPADAANGDVSQTPDAASAGCRPQAKIHPKRCRPTDPKVQLLFKKTEIPRLQSEARAELEDYRPQVDPAATCSCHCWHDVGFSTVSSPTVFCSCS